MTREYKISGWPCAILVLFPAWIGWITILYVLTLGVRAVFA